MRARRHPSRKRPGNREWDRVTEVERIARAEEEGWRETVFAYLFDPSPYVRGEASEWLVAEPETKRAEHALVLRDSRWDVRYNATAGWLAFPECPIAPDWVPDLFAGALARERNEIVVRQILLMLGRWAPDRLPPEVASHVRDLNGYATTGIAIAEIWNGNSRGWNRLTSLFSDEGKEEGITFALNVLSEKIETLGAPGPEARAYVVALQTWLHLLVWSPARKEEASDRAVPLINWASTTE